MKVSFGTFEIVFWLFFGATLLAILFGAYLITELRTYPEEFRRAGSPSRFWNDGRSFVFLWYVLAGRFTSLPDANLVSHFRVFRAFEGFRLLLFGVFLFLCL